MPAMANAGVVSGQCVNCHTMHASTNGVGAAPNATLLRAGSTCEGCHATGGGNNTTTGVKAFATFSAPQVDDNSATGMLSGGYFVKNNTVDAKQHNPFSDLTGMNVDGNLGVTPPGGAALAGGTFGCANCHDASGGHHGGAGTVYRLLSGVTGTADGCYGVGFNRSANAYDSASLDTKCGSCHGLFHGASNQGAVNAWTRHPTDVSLTTMDVATQPYGYVANYNANADTDLLPLGTAGAATDMIMCVTCHVAHGSANDKLLSFDYTAVQAGDATNSGGCESCHDYGAGM
ncbi:MAG: hypothetical protein KJ950_04230 [Proteobacteria bacterium]|nr:hypothetical protein [Pseudomonadota bacterium]MBU1688473.1 hypothetical protein [Pseudomonadota bacterium]